MTLQAIAQVVPAVPSFSVDDGFSYVVPRGVTVEVGSIVRVPLAGRRVRGYVTAVRTGDTTGLKELLRTSSPVPVFSPRLLETLRSIAVHYVAPQSVILAKTAPPNLPGTGGPLPTGAVPTGDGSGTLAEQARRWADGGYERPHYLLGRSPWHEAAAELAGPSLAADRSAMVVMPTVTEMQAMVDHLDEVLPGRVVSATSSEPARQITSLWSRARRQPGLVVVGTREIVFWPVADLALAIMVGEGRKGMKEKSTPTIHAREVLRRRAAVERFGLVFAGSVPTSEIVAAGIPVSRAGGTRIWPLVEIVDRNEEPPGTGFLSQRAVSAIRAVVAGGGTVFVFTHRRGYAPSYRCSDCRLVRTCPECGARAERSAQCARCGTDLGGCRNCGGRAFEPLGAGAERIAEALSRLSLPVGPPDGNTPVRVGTERDLPGLEPVDLAVVVDADGLIHAPHYRAGEDALRLLARVAETVGRGTGRRCLVQTGRPDDPVIAALRHGDPMKFLDQTVTERNATRLPPIGDVLVVELDGSTAVDGRLRNLASDRADVFGPAERAGRYRWLVQGDDLRQLKIGLRRLVQEWRDAGRRVRIDVDPVDL